EPGNLANVDGARFVIPALKDPRNVLGCARFTATIGAVPPSSLAAVGARIGCIRPLGGRWRRLRRRRALVGAPLGRRWLISHVHSHPRPPRLPCHPLPRLDTQATRGRGTPAARAVAGRLLPTNA